jgi:hypothetical protein
MGSSVRGRWLERNPQSHAGSPGKPFESACRRLHPSAFEPRDHRLRCVHALGKLLLGETGLFLPLFCAPDGAKSPGGNSRLEPLEDLAEQPRRQESVREALGLSGGHRAEIGAGPDEAVYLAHHDP